MNTQSHLEEELKVLKTDVLDMWRLVRSQLEKGKQALVNNDKDLAREVVAVERRVNAYELKIDRECEDLFALFSPLAVDLRFVLAVLKINSNLERIGDIAEGISRLVADVDKRFDSHLLKETRIIEMFELSDSMLKDAAIAFEQEDTKLARTLFKHQHQRGPISHLPGFNDIRPAG